MREFLDKTLSNIKTNYLLRSLLAFLFGAIFFRWGGVLVVYTLILMILLVIVFPIPQSKQKVLSMVLVGIFIFVLLATYMSMFGI